MKLRSLLFGAALVVSSSAFAQDEATTPAAADPQSISVGNGSEFLYQTPGGQFDLTPGVIFTSVRADSRTNDDITYVISKFSTVVGAEYGISPMFSIAGNFGYSFGTSSIEDCPSGFTCDSSKGSGMEDPSIDFKSAFPVGPGLLRVTAEFEFALEDSETEADDDYNYASGGNSLTPAIAYEATVGASTFGGKLSYAIYQSDQNEKNGTVKSKTEPGDSMSVAAFYEYRLPKVTLGGSLAYFTTGDSTEKTNGVSTKQDDDGKGLAFQFYAPVYFNPRVTLLPTIAIGSYDAKDSAPTKDPVTTLLGCGVRLSF